MNALLGDISTGNTGFADVMFLVGMILAVLAAVVSIPRSPNDARPWSGTLLALAVAAVALGWLVL